MMTQLLSNEIEVCGQKSHGRTNERTNGDIEALADARRALEKSSRYLTPLLTLKLNCEKLNTGHTLRNLSHFISGKYKGCVI